MEKALLRLDKNDFRILHGKMQLARAKQGMVLVKEGVPPLGLFIVREGSVLVKRQVNGFSVTSTTLGRNEIFGETAFISPAPAPATATVVAAEDSDLILFTPKRLEPVFEEHPALFGRFFQSIALTLSRRLRAFNEQTGSTKPKRDHFGDLPNWEIV